MRRHWRRTENIPETGPMRNHPADSRAESAPALECLERPKFHQGHSATNRRDCGRGLTQPENIRTSEAVKQRQSDGPEKGANPDVCGALIKLVSICQTENSQKPKVGLSVFNHGVTDITDARRSENYPRYPRNPWRKRFAGLAAKRRRSHKKERDGRILSQSSLSPDTEEEGG